jgi:hypothetical protein
MHAQTCPKCNGQGHTCMPPWLDGSVKTFTTDGTVYSCTVCHGTGKVFIPDSEEEMNKIMPEEEEIKK